MNSKQKPQSLSKKVNTASRLRLTLKQASLIPVKNNMILTENSLSIFVVILFVEMKSTSITSISQKDSTIKLRVSCSSMICGNTSLTQQKNGESSDYNIPHETVNNLNISHIKLNQYLASYCKKIEKQDVNSKTDNTPAWKKKRKLKEYISNKSPLFVISSGIFKC